MIFLKYFIIVTLVPFILDILSLKKEPKNYTKSLNKFTIRTGKSIAFLGLIWFAFITAILFLCLYQNDGVTIAVTIAFGISYCLSLLSFLYPAPRFWDIVVNVDNITVIKFFVFTKRTAFSEIEKVEIANNNYIKVYKNGMKRVFFLIDPSMNGKNNFLKRIEKENIQLIDNRNLNGNISDDELEE